MLNKNKYIRTSETASIKPFGTRFLTKLETVNNKLTCNLSRTGADLCSDLYGTGCSADRPREEEELQ